MSNRISKNSRLKWVGFFLGAIYLSVLCTSSGWAAEPDIAQKDAYQARFEEGASLFLSGNYLRAAYIFEQLYADTQSQRVKLEWARAIYFLGNKNKAKELFNEVLATNPPLPVREKINAFLDDIAISNGKFDYDFGVVRDTNPRAVPLNRTFNIFGTPLTYVPQFDTSPQYGLSYRLIASKSLDDYNKLVGSISMYGIKFGSTAFDRNNIEVGLAYRLSDSPRWQTRMAIERMNFAGEHLYDYPSVSISNSVENIIGNAWANEVKGGRMIYPVYSYLNGPLISYSTSVVKNVSPQTNVGVELYIDRSSAAESAYAYRTNLISLFGNLYQGNSGIKALLKISSSSKEYDATDPFFGEMRLDKRNSVMLTLAADKLNLFGVTPTLDLGYEKTNSNITFYTFDKVTATIYFKKAY